MREGQVAILPGWDRSMGLTIIDGAFCWVEPGWDGYTVKNGAAVDHKLVLSEDWRMATCPAKPL